MFEDKQFYWVVTIAGNMQHMKPVKIAQVSYFMHLDV